jgi:SET domain-containing protein
MYRPLPSNLTIKNSNIDGLGLFSTEFIPAETDLGMTHIYDDRFPDNYIRLPLGGFFNHSITPNCEIVDSIDNGIKHLRLKTIVDIHPGDEITAYYTIYQP